MSATSWLGEDGRGSGLRKFGGAASPMVELSQSFSDMPARRAAASALSRTDGSMPSTLHDTREFMIPSGSDSGAPTWRLGRPARPETETIQFRAGRLPQLPTFSGYGKYRVKEWARRPLKLLCGRGKCGFGGLGDGLPLAAGFALGIAERNHLVVMAQRRQRRD